MYTTCYVTHNTIFKNRKCPAYQDSRRLDLSGMLKPPKSGRAVRNNNVEKRRAGSLLVPGASARPAVHEIWNSRRRASVFDQAAVLYRMIEGLVSPILHISAFVFLRRSPRDIELIAQVLELTNVVASVVGHGRQEHLIVETVVLLHKAFQVHQVLMAHAEHVTPDEIQMLEGVVLDAIDGVVATHIAHNVGGNMHVVALQAVDLPDEVIPFTAQHKVALHHEIVLVGMLLRELYQRFQRIGQPAVVAVEKAWQFI